MGKFNFEDYRQPWETGPHWELKKEFIETYQDMFEEDRLLCLAQAYSNVVLMNCSYPDPVMRQISELSKPLKMRKKFQGTSNSDETPPSKSDQTREKIKFISARTGRPFKQVKFCSASEEQLKSTPPDLTNMHQSPSEQFKTPCPLSVPSQQSTQSSLQIGVIPSNNNSEKEPLPNENNTCLEKEQDEQIISALGLPFIKSFVEKLAKKNIQEKESNITGALFGVLNSLGVKDGFHFKFDVDPNSPEHARLFISTFLLKNCEIASSTASKKKEAKVLSAKAAIDTFVRLAISNIPSAKTKLKKKLLLQNKPSTHKVIDSPEVLELFCKNILSRKRTKKETAIFTLKSTASLLGMGDYIAFDVTSYKISPTQTEYCCKFFLKNVLISSGKASHRNDAEKIAADLGLEKLAKLSDYEICNGELEKRNSSSQTSYPDTSSVSQSFTETNIEKPCFILNRTMYDQSVRDGFMLIKREKNETDIQKFSKTIISESASFNHKKFEYQIEDDFETMPPTKKVAVLIDGVVVGNGAALIKEEAKGIACTKALNDLKKKYYTLRIKNEYIEGFIVTRNQVFDGESFSSNVISESNIGRKMLKSMGWTGGGLGEKGISEPIQTDAKLSLGAGLGFGASNDRQTLQLFRKRLEAMLLEFCRSENFSDLVFSKDFTKEERKEIHQLASRMHLHTVSRGVKNDRFLTVRQKYETVKLLKFLVNNGGSNSKFELIDDSSFSLEI